MTEHNQSDIETIIFPDDKKEMVLLPGGTFIMGSDDDTPNTKPTHRVSVAGFYIDRWPVTNAEYKRFIDATGHPVPHYHVPWCDTEGYNWNINSRTFPEGKGEHPVVLVTWEDALAYAAWANKRLPTEAEWEFAARGLAGRRYSWGAEFLPNHCNSAEAHLGGTSPVGLFSPQGDTPEGIVDLVGNVWEWTNSLFRPYPYRSDDGREDPASGKWRVLRGASWVNNAITATAIARLDGDFLFYNNVGFRCAVDTGEE